MDARIVMCWIGPLLTALCGRRCSGCGRSGASTPCSSCCDVLGRLPARDDAAWPDVGVAGRLVRSAKFGHWRGGGRVLAVLAADRLPNCELDVVTWVPADRRRRAARGGHVPEQLARTWARARGTPARGMLVRTTGRAQKGLDRRARQRNVAGVWRLESTIVPASLAGVRILLVDDVRTTGATLDSAAAQLVAAGATVIPFALTWHDRRDKHVENPARCEEFSLTTGVLPADSVQHDRRKDAPRVRKPRPP